MKKSPPSAADGEDERTVSGGGEVGAAASAVLAANSAIMAAPTAMATAPIDRWRRCCKPLLGALADVIWSMSLLPFWLLVVFGLRTLWLRSPSHAAHRSRNYIMSTDFVMINHWLSSAAVGRSPRARPTRTR